MSEQDSGSLCSSINKIFAFFTATNTKNSRLERETGEFL